MTHEHVTDFAQELVKMAMATTRVPQLEQEVRTLRNENNHNLDTIQRLELKLIDKEARIESLQSTIRSLEVSRDDAELRFLECDDAKGTLVRVLEGFMADAKGVLQAIAPVAEAVTEPTLPRNTFQGVKTDYPLQDGPLSPFVPPPTPDVTPTTDASSSDDTEGSVPVDPTPAIASHVPMQCSVIDTANHTENATSVSLQGDDGVSVPSDPTVSEPTPSTESPNVTSSGATDTTNAPSTRDPRYNDYDDHSPF